MADPETSTVAQLDAGLTELADHLFAKLPGCMVTRYQHYLLVELAGANTAVHTREQADRAVEMLRARAQSEAFRHEYLRVYSARFPNGCHCFNGGDSANCDCKALETEIAARVGGK